MKRLAWAIGFLLAACSGSGAGSSTTGTTGSAAPAAATLTGSSGPTSTAASSSTGSGTTGTTSAILGDECISCTADSDCGPGGFCVAIIGGKSCSAPCGSNRTCADPGSTCHTINNAALEPIGSGCLPSSNSCAGATLGSTGATAGTSTASTGGLSSSTATSSTSTTTGTTGSTGSLSCTTCDLNNPSCPSGQSCVAVRDAASAPGFCALPCDGSWSCSDAQSTCVNAGGSPACFPWGCLGLGTSATLPAPEPWPQIADQGGTVSASAQIVPVLFQSYPSALLNQIPTFVGEMVSSGFLQQTVGEYGVTSVSSEAASMLSDSPPGSIDDPGIQTWLAQLISAGKVPAPTSGTVYLLFFPSTTTIYQDPGHTQQSCQQFTGYHGPAVISGPVTYAYGVIPDCGPNGFGPTELQSIEAVASHEAAEAITDPDGSHPAWIMPSPQSSDSAWAGMEIADMCEDMFAPLGSGGDEVQRIWSNTLAEAGGSPCGPAPSGGVTALAGLPFQIATHAGAQIRFPVIGWSTRGDASVSYNAVGSATFVNAVSTPPGLAPLGQVIPYSLAIPSGSSGLVSGEIVSLDSSKQIQAFWPVQVIVQ